MGWITEKLFGKKQTYEEEFASNLYDALVLNGGPSSEADDRIDAAALEIPLDKLDRFAAKRLILLEAFLFVATNVATVVAEEEDTPLFQSAHPLAVQVGKLLKEKWRQRGIEFADHYSVGERCFQEVSTALEKPFKWGRAWLEEFYGDPEQSGEHYILWTDQCIKEFQTMKAVVEQNT